MSYVNINPRIEEPIVVVVNGYPLSGKDTLCEFAIMNYPCIIYSTVDTVKEVAAIFGWNGQKTPENRNMLSALKDFYVEWFDGTFNEMTSLITYEYIVGVSQFVFMHTREPQEIARISQWCKDTGKKCFTLFVSRDEVSKDHGNHADSGVSNYDYDVYIENNGTKEEFREKTLALLEKMVSNKIINDTITV